MQKRHVDLQRSAHLRYQYAGNSESLPNTFVKSVS